MMTKSKRDVVIANRFFSFLFRDDVFDYWYVDMMTARLIGKTKAMGLMLVYHLNKNPGWGGLAMRAMNAALQKSVIAEVFWAARILKVNLQYHKGNQIVEFDNGNQLHFKGANTKTAFEVTLSGFQANYDVVKWLVWLEEMFEFTEVQYGHIAQAVRNSNPDPTAIKTPPTIFTTSNPWYEDHWWVQRLASFQPFDEDLIDKHHHIIGDHEFDPVDKKYRRKIIYADVYNNPFNSPQDIRRLESTVAAQPWSRNPVIRGLPGVLSGSIYAHLLPNTEIDEKEVKINRMIEFTVGIDFGEISDSTSVVLIANDHNYQKIYVIAEYEYKPTEFGVRLERNHIASLVDAKVREWVETFGLKYVAERIYCIVDNSAVVFLDRLKTFNDDLIRYIPSRKELIDRRIDLVTMLMAEGRIKLVKKDILHKEFRRSVWKQKKSDGLIIKERSGDNDHMLNAFEYAIERRWKTYHEILKMSI